MQEKFCILQENEMGGVAGKQVRNSELEQRRRSQGLRWSMREKDPEEDGSTSSTSLSPVPRV